MYERTTLIMVIKVKSMTLSTSLFEVNFIFVSLSILTTDKYTVIKLEIFFFSFQYLPSFNSRNRMASIGEFLALIGIFLNKYFTNLLNICDFSLFYNMKISVNIKNNIKTTAWQYPCLHIKHVAKIGML